MALPILYTVYDELKQPSYDVNLTLGTAFFFTWILTAIFLITGVLFRMKEQKEDDFYAL